MTPDTYTIAEHHFSVGDGHKLYVHDWGNPDAKQVIISLHGGPGSSAKTSTKIYLTRLVSMSYFSTSAAAARVLHMVH